MQLVWKQQVKVEATFFSYLPELLPCIFHGKEGKDEEGERSSSFSHISGIARCFYR